MKSDVVALPREHIVQMQKAIEYANRAIKMLRKRNDELQRENGKLHKELQECKEKTLGEELKSEAVQDAVTALKELGLPVTEAKDLVKEVYRLGMSTEEL